MLASCTGGCERWRERRAERKLERERAAELADKEFLEASQPGVGIELVPVRDASPRVAEVLGAYETRPVPADPALLYRWRLAGLRVIALPADEAADILDRFERAGVGDARQWTEVPNWSPIVAGPWEESEIVGTGERAARVGVGRTRLLARAWFEPWIGDGGIETTMRLEFVPQRERPRSARTLSPVDAPDRPGGEADAGPVFNELSLTLRATGGDAFVIVGAGSDEDWTNPDEPAPVGDAPAVGPETPRVRVIGESMLIDPGAVIEERDAVRVRTPVRVLVVIRPRMPQGGGSS
ncbi:MAG: hypothetical protein RIB60_06435 [Phycisphaerales bacterium]